MTEELSPEQVQVIVATVELVGRTGARNFEVGYLHDDVPSEEAGWWASAQYRGAKVMVEDQKSPLAACDALAVRLLTDAHCVHCGRVVSVDGGRTPRGRCRWYRTGNHWQEGCR